MSSSLSTEIPICLHMCISYSALVIAQYWHDTPSLTQTRPTTVLELLTALEEWCSTCPHVPLVSSYSAGLAKRRVQASIRDGRDHLPGSGGGRGRDDAALRQDAETAGSPAYSAAEGLLGLGGVPVVGHGSDGMLDMSDLAFTPGFLSIEDFFSGGFLEYCR